METNRLLLGVDIFVNYNVFTQAMFGCCCDFQISRPRPAFQPDLLKQK